MPDSTFSTPSRTFQGATVEVISAEDGVRLIKEHFPKRPASELKYRWLSRRPANHPRLLWGSGAS